MGEENISKEGKIAHLAQSEGHPPLSPHRGGQRGGLADGFTSFYPSYSTETQMNADFVVSAQSNDYQD